MGWAYAFLRGEFVVSEFETRFDTSQSDDMDRSAAARRVRSQVALALTQIIEPSEIDVLLIGDDFGQLDAVVGALKSSDFFDVRVTMTCSIETARTALQIQTFDVVIANGVCGTQAFAEVPNLSMQSATLAITNNPTAGATAQALTSGAMAVLAAREITADLLQRTLQQILLRREAQNLLIDRLLSAVSGEPVPQERLPSSVPLCAPSKPTKPNHEGMSAAV